MTDELVFSLSVQLSPYLMEKIAFAKDNNIRFSHYTSAYVAMEIIEKNEVWLRNAIVMNDFSEVQHGQQCLLEAWIDDAVGGRLRKLLESLRQGLADELATSFDQRNHDRVAQSYLVSISEHGNGTIDEDKYGRLSMWRAYGGENNVAFVFKNTPFLSESNALNAFTSPVLYADATRFKTEFSRVVDNFETHLGLAQQLGPDVVKQVLESAFHFACLSTKHPGFAEEREWRVIYSPTMWPSEKILSSIKTVGGVPQKIHRIPLANFPEEGFTGATLPELLEEIIIGPTENAFSIYDALVEKLGEAGVLEPWNKVRRSNIPLRR
jgi:Protein of unknown function (DUF2971)